ncbi:MAG: amidase family protein [Gammaproteobacteria bacterium]|jgi:mandelamide amidase|nr:amidase family protein [Gammaproteobacteria bacterium]
MENFNGNSLLQLSLGETANHLRSGDLSARDLAEAVITAARQYSDLNAYTTFVADRLRSSAIEADSARNRGDKIGLLHGVPVILKDNINTATLPTSGGTPGLINNRPGDDAPVAARLFAGGALLAGKANLHELSSGGTSNNHTFGAVGNPYDMTRIPGGSSGGTAAAVAAHLVPGGLGTDTGGSVRVPAALCGVAGLRPTTGRYPTAGIVPLSSTMDTAGPIARNITDVALMDAVITEEFKDLVSPLPASLRMGVPYDSLMKATGNDVKSVIDKALDTLQAAGITLVPVKLTEIKALTTRAFGALIGYEFRHAMTDYLELFAPGLTVDELSEQIASPSTKKMLQGKTGRTINKDFYQEVLNEHLPHLKQMHVRLFEHHRIDALIFPTTPEVALPRAEDDSVYRDGKPAFSWFYFSNTVLASVAGNPSLTIPAGLSAEGMPAGISIDGLPGADRKILAIGQLVERLLA